MVTSKFKSLLGIGILAVGMATCLPATADSTINMASDGAVSVNAKWEAAKSSVWFIELQRDGVPLIEKGMAQENDAMIRQGLKALDWGFSKEAADGSFPGTSDPFHSVSLFVNAGIRTVNLLKGYQPRTYTLDANYYSNKIATYTQQLHQTGLWLLATGPTINGKRGDIPYTHRRYILAETLADVGTLTNDSSLVAASIPYALDGISLQTATGVDPEVGGFDVNYQCAGLLQAERFYHLCPNSSVRSALIPIITNGLNYESHYIDVNGNVSTLGSTREGIETNRDGTVKVPNVCDIYATFVSGANLAHSPQFAVVAQRLRDKGALPSNAIISQSGAVDDNGLYKALPGQKWNVSLQKVGADYISMGIAREDDAVIRTGVKVLSWAVSRQASDGSFPNCSCAYTNTALYAESVARAAQLLNGYNPSTYTADLAYYQQAGQMFEASALSASNWLIQPVNVQKYSVIYGSSASNAFVLAAALSETAALTGDATVRTAALSQIPYALGTLINGVAPVGGQFDVNQQAVAMLYLARTGEVTTDPAFTVQIANALRVGLDIENSYVDSSGNISGTKSPLATTIANAYGEAYPLTLHRILLIVHNRLTGSSDLR